MSTDESVSFSLEVNVEKGYTEVRKLLTILDRTIQRLQSLGLPPHLDQAVTHIQEITAMLNQLRLALLAVQTASGPGGWALAILAGLTAFTSVGEASAQFAREGARSNLRGGK